MNIIHHIVFFASFLLIVNGHPTADDVVAFNVIENPTESFDGSSRTAAAAPPVVLPPQAACGVGNMGPNTVCTRLSTGCYCIVYQQLSWLKAFQFCSANGKKLLSIPTAAVHSDLKSNLPALIGTNNIVTRVGLWTRGTYLKSQNIFVWATTLTSGTKFDFARWQYGSPKNTQIANDCVRLIVKDGNSVCNLADLDCGQYLPFICQSS